jgi:hypothetical protein
MLREHFLKHITTKVNNPPNIAHKKANSKVALVSIYFPFSLVNSKAITAMVITNMNSINIICVTILSPFKSS